MANLPFTTTELIRAAAYRLTPPTSDIVDGTNDVDNKLAVTAGVEYRLSIGTPSRNFTNGFNSNTGITTMFDVDDDIGIYSEFMDTPTIVALPNCIFQPAVSNPGECIIRMYVNETVPILHDQAIVGYQGQTPEKMGDLFLFYLGDEDGYRLKNKGIYFTFEFTTPGNLWDKALYQTLT